ncbi:MAG: serine/threonine protein kinase, partial [Deltaproteobacteria bacterium]|nr:serine/threonine protein kinase [Deltaproteobacteria bacterium]
MELVTLASQTSFAPAAGSVGNAASPGAELLPGTRVGRFEVLDERGRGAMGVVYAAHDPQLDRRVALKLVDDARGDDRARLALLREAKALARVTHPNVLTIYDLGTYEASVFLATELVEGESLAAWSARAHGWRTTVAVFLDAARGLAAAHAAGVVHRDFKPANVLVGADGRMRVCDFGLARFAEAAAGPRELVGTPVYMAPEQRRGEVADARSDQYAFCVAWHEALFGHRPDHPAARKAAVPRWLAAIVTRGLAAAPERRFPS